MKYLLSSFLIMLPLFSIMFIATAPHASEIDELKARLKFLEAQKEIIDKLDGMQSNIDGLRGKIDGLQKELDGLRVQFDLKSSKPDVSNKNENTKTIKSNSKTNIYTYTWSATVCDRFKTRLRVVIDTKKLGIKVTNLDSGENWTDGIVLKAGKHYFKMDVAAGDFIVEFSGHALPSGGPATVYNAHGACDGAARLVPVKN